MTEQRIPTEAEWGLVETLLNLKNYVRSDNSMYLIHLLYLPDGKEHNLYFDPFGNSNDTDRLVQAMQAAGCLVERYAYPPSYPMPNGAKVTSSDGYQTGVYMEDDDSRATTFACIDALAAEEKRKQENQHEQR